ncbi:hypothetical protein [uncultured Treponema sp.]|uniref:capsular polysaccharide export protein, LipB/KpsS family n=1 Tax=uncultured Treponema sp. TaxID=162155 RepID=UPI0025EF1B4F|nr:hypothetical protein [uncultured Treponema sp.]
MILDNPFLRFEKKSDIFQIKNDKGIYIWDIFRYYIGCSLDDENPNINSYKNIHNSLKICRLLKFPKYFFCFIYYLFFLFISRKKYDNMFFVASRNQFDGDFIDQNSFDTYKLFKSKKNLVIESFLRRKSKHYNSDIFFTAYLLPIIKLIYRPKISKTDKACIERICALLTSEFPNKIIKVHDLYGLLISFYRDIYLYKRILKQHKINKIFLTQNGIQKGMFYIASEMNIPLYEFQHGIIGNFHYAYSYPKIENLKDYIYIPTKFLTFSDYWCNSLYTPIKNVCIGNNYFSKSVQKRTDASKILVISADVFGKQLAYVIKNAINNNIIKSTDVIFKLHPNQYFEKTYFDDFFDKEVTVYTNEYSVNELLEESKCMITVCSTAVYEALQSKTKVLIYEYDMYKDLSLLFNDKNLFLFSNIDELKQDINTTVSDDYKAPVFFEKCTSKKIKKALDE